MLLSRRRMLARTSLWGSLALVLLGACRGARPSPQAKEEATVVPERVPPGQRVVQRLPVLDLGVRPAVPLEKWQLEVGGRVRNPVVLSWQEFRELPHVRRTWDFHCVTGWSKLDVLWGGVLIREIIGLVGPKEGTVAVIFECRDGYSTNVLYEELREREALLADELEGEPLPLEHGGPVRAVIPYLYAWKSAKFLQRIRFEPVDEPGYWEVRGYHNHADPWKEERFG